MQLQAAHHRHSTRQTGDLAVGFQGFRPRVAARGPKTPARDVTMRTGKATTLDYDDLQYALPRPNPEKRVLEEINFRDLVDKTANWRALKELEEVLRERYERQPNLAVSVVVRASELVDMEVASPGQRREVVRMMDSSLAPFIVKKGIYSYRPSILPRLLAALAALQYSHPRLNDALMKLLETGVETERVNLLVSALCSATQLGVRLGPELLEKVGARVLYTMKHCTATDVGNIATTLAPYKKLPASMGRAFLMRLADQSQPLLGALSGEQLVDLMQVFVRQSYTPSSPWVSSFQAALLAGLPGLTQPKAFASLLFCLAKGSLAITEDFLAALLRRLAAPASPSSSAVVSPSLLALMRPAELAVVASVLSIYGYTPAEEWSREFVAALERRAEDMEVQQVVTIVDSCLELSIPVSADLLDELLAVVEGGLAGLAPPRLLQLVSALSAADHRPDGPWLKKLQAALESRAAAATPSELVDIVSLPAFMPYAFAPDGDSTAAVLKAVKARADALKGLDATTCGSVQQALQQLGYAGAAVFAASLAPSPPPPPPRAAAAGRKVAAAAAPAAPAARAAAPAAPVSTAGRLSSSVAAPQAGPSRGQSSFSSNEPQMVASSRADRRRGRTIRYEEDEDEEDDEVDFDGGAYGSRRSVPAARGQDFRGSSPPPAMVASSRADSRRQGPPASLFDDDDQYDDEGDMYVMPRGRTGAVSRPSSGRQQADMVASSRGDRRRAPPSQYDDEEDEEAEGDDFEDEGTYNRANPRRAPPPPPSSYRGGAASNTGTDGSEDISDGFVASTRTSRRR